MSDQVPVKTVAEKIADDFEDFTTKVYATYGEPLMLALIIEWKAGGDSLPAGILTTRPEWSPKNPVLLRRMVERLMKFTNKITTVLLKYFDAKIDAGIRDSGKQNESEPAIN